MVGKEKHNLFLPKNHPMLLRQPPKGIICTLGALILLSFLYLSKTLQEWTYRSVELSITANVNNSTLGFEKVFVVGLPSRTDRRDGMTLQAALSDVSIDFIDGVRGDDVPDNAIPSAPGHERLGAGSIGSWRAHMDAIREVIHKNLSSALILEDDVDWDVRIKRQLHDFALSSQALTQPMAATPDWYADSTYPILVEGTSTRLPDLLFHELPKTSAATLSPYGDDWDLLWLGHCGMDFPPDTAPGIPKGRIIHTEDETVPEKRYLWSLVNPFTLVDEYPERTRAVHHSQGGVCSLGYAVSQSGARKLLQEVALKDVSDAFDILLRFFCDGVKGRKQHICLTIQPGLFHHHRPAGPQSAQSDIGNHGEGFNENSRTDMVKWSVRLNAETLLDGGNVMWDQYPDV